MRVALNVIAGVVIHNAVILATESFEINVREICRDFVLNGFGRYPDLFESMYLPASHRPVVLVLPFRIHFVQ